jgi:hypothetical protein
MIGHTGTRKVSAAASQPLSTATRQVTTIDSTAVTSSPTEATTARRRKADACQPNNRWYTVGAGTTIGVV